MINLNFINNIIKAHIDGYKSDCNSNFLTEQEAQNKIEALEVLRDSVKDFIRESNKLTETNKNLGYHE